MEKDNKTKMIEDIAKRILHLDTLMSRGSDSLDFTDQAVWNIEAALHLAYQAGFAAATGDHAKRGELNIE